MNGDTGMSVYQSAHVERFVHDLRRLIAVHHLDTDTGRCHACKASCPCEPANAAFNQLTAMRIPAAAPMPGQTPRPRAPLLTRVWTTTHTTTHTTGHNTVPPNRRPADRARAGTQKPTGTPNQTGTDDRFGTEKPTGTQNRGRTSCNPIRPNTSTRFSTN
jgi:hypothetical protein